MNLIGCFKKGVKDYCGFLQMDIKDVPYQFNVLSPKVPKHTEEENKEMRREAVSHVGGYGDGKYSFYKGRYVTSEDIKKRKEELRGYRF